MNTFLFLIIVDKQIKTVFNFTLKIIASGSCPLSINLFHFESVEWEVRS